MLLPLIITIAEPKVAMFRAIPPILFISSLVCLLQTSPFFAAPIPQSTQPFGVLLQHLGPTPEQPSLQSEQQSPALQSSPPSQPIFAGAPVMIFFAQERSTPLLQPRAWQLGTAGRQMQQPNAQKPSLHLGYTMAPLCSHFPWPLSCSHRLNIPLLLNPSPPRHPQPTPLPYSTNRQQSPWSAQPEPVRQFWWQSTPLLEYPAGHGGQHRAPIWSNEPHAVGMVPAPLSQLSFQQKSAERESWLLRERQSEGLTSRSTAKTIKQVFIFKLSKIKIINALKINLKNVFLLPIF